MHENHLEVWIKYKFLDSTLRISDSIGFGWRLKDTFLLSFGVILLAWQPTLRITDLLMQYISIIHCFNHLPQILVYNVSFIIHFQIFSNFSSLTHVVSFKIFESVWHCYLLLLISPSIVL